jgi:hypothetical protein
MGSELEPAHHSYRYERACFFSFFCEFLCVCVCVGEVRGGWAVNLSLRTTLTGLYIFLYDRACFFF